MLAVRGFIESEAIVGIALAVYPNSFFQFQLSLDYHSATNLFDMRGWKMPQWYFPTDELGVGSSKRILVYAIAEFSWQP
jgi:hypothetical protein